MPALDEANVNRLLHFMTTIPERRAQNEDFLVIYGSFQRGVGFAENGVADWASLPEETLTRSHALFTAAKAYSPQVTAFRERVGLSEPFAGSGENTQAHERRLDRLLEKTTQALADRGIEPAQIEAFDINAAFGVRLTPPERKIARLTAQGAAIM